jgi:hypothetical protein
MVNDYNLVPQRGSTKSKPRTRLSVELHNKQRIINTKIVTTVDMAKYTNNCIKDKWRSTGIYGKEDMQVENSDKDGVETTDVTMTNVDLGAGSRESMEVASSQWSRSN